MENNKEKRAENFIRLAESRTDKIICMLDLIGNLSNKSFYDYSDEQIEKIFNAIEEALIINKNKFKTKNKKNKRRFTL